MAILCFFVQLSSELVGLQVAYSFAGKRINCSEGTSTEKDINNMQGYSTPEEAELCAYVHEGKLRMPWTNIHPNSRFSTRI